MPVYNVERHVERAIGSILRQSQPPFELVVGDDGSTDRTAEILARIAAFHPSLRVLRRDRPSGVANAANWVVAAARGELVAMAHADDLSLPDRLARQAATLADHPEAVLVGAPAVGIDSSGRPIHPANLWRVVHPTAFAPFTHSSIMFRREAFDRVGGYRASANYWEDLDLFWRLSTAGELLVLPYALTAYRYSDDSIRQRDRAGEVEQAIDRMYRDAERIERTRPPAGGDFPPGSSGRIRPRVFVARSWTAIWTARRPRTLGRLLRHGDLRCNRDTLLALAFVCAGEMAPRLTRAVLRMAARVRNRWVQRRLRSGEPLSWRPLGGSDDGPT